MGALKLTVNAGPHRRVNCPVSALVDVPGRAATVTLTDVKAGKAVPCQASREDGKLRLNWIIDDLAAEATAAYELEVGVKARVGTTGVALNQKRNSIEVIIDGSRFTEYRYGTKLARPHLYPVIGPYGKGVTRPLAKPGDGLDHPHHRSIYISHGEVNGFNNWSETQGHARTVHREFELLESGPALGRIAAVSAWVGTEGWVTPRGSAELLEERATWTFYNTPPEVRIIDLHVTLTALEMDVLFGDTKEGGLASIRVAESMEVRSGLGGVIENAIGGKNEDETWGKRAAWCHYSGPVSRKRVGIAIMDHPDSFRHPTYWHVRNYGLMTANPFGLSHYYSDPKRRGHHVLSPGESLVGHFRFYVHAGDATEGGIGERYHDFAHPPKVKVG